MPKQLITKAQKETLDAIVNRISWKQNQRTWIGRLKEEDLFYKVIYDAPAVHKRIKEAVQWGRTDNMQANTKGNYYKLISKILRNATLEEKRILLRLPKKGSNKETIETTFDDKIHHLFKKENFIRTNKIQKEQVMTESDYANYIEAGILREVCSEQLALITSQNAIEKQMWVALGMMLFADKLRRNDIALVKFQNATTQDPVMLSQECRRMIIRRCNKTEEENVLITFQKNIRPFIRLLKEARIREGKGNYLFRKILEKDNMGQPKSTDPDCDWFSQRFVWCMEKEFGKKISVHLVRIILGIEISRNDVGGDIAYQRMIEAKFGHSYDIHNQYYNLFRTFQNREIPNPEAEAEDTISGDEDEFD